LTRQGEVFGSFDYMAPEQADDSHSVDARADIYGLGCTLFRLLTGRVPFDDPPYNSATQKILAHAQITPPSIRDLREDVPAAVANLVAMMLAKQPSERPQRMDEVIDQLAPFAQGANLNKLVAACLAEDLADLSATADTRPTEVTQGGEGLLRSLGATASFDERLETATRRISRTSPPHRWWSGDLQTNCSQRG
jgi:serine/threonine protein kinase